MSYLIYDTGDRTYPWVWRIEFKALTPPGGWGVSTVDIAEMARRRVA